MTIDVQNSLGLLSASRAGEHLSLVTEVSEVVVRFGSFRQRGELAAVRTGRSLFPVNTFRLSIFHEAYPQMPKTAPSVVRSQRGGKPTSRIQSNRGRSVAAILASFVSQSTSAAGIAKADCLPAANSHGHGPAAEKRPAPSMCVARRMR
jgi:hypothetical protein